MILKHLIYPNQSTLRQVKLEQEHVITDVHSVRLAGKGRHTANLCVHRPERLCRFGIPSSVLAQFNIATVKAANLRSNTRGFRRARSSTQFNRSSGLCPTITQGLSCPGAK